MRKSLCSILTAGICLLFVQESHAAGWTQQISHTGARLGGTYFIDENTGFVAGDSGIMLKTKNGGATWTRMSVGSDEPLMYLHAIDSNLVYVCAWNGKLWKTTDAGSTWSIALSPFDSTNARGIFFTSAQKGFLCIGHYPSGGTSRILRTRNGGTNWDTVFTTNEWLSYINFPDAAHGYATGSSGHVAKTADSGATWTPLTLPGNMFLSGVFFLNKDTGFVGGISGRSGNTYQYKKVFRTMDGGTTWIVVDSTITAISLFFVNDHTGYAIGGDSMIITNPANPSNIRLMMTQNGGTTWERVDLGTSLNQNAFWFPSANIGYVTGDSGMIFKYQGIVGTKKDPVTPNRRLVEISAVILQSDRLRIHYSLSSVHADRVFFSLYSIQGNRIWKTKLANPAGTHEAVFPMAFPIVPGMYIVKMSATNTITGGNTIVTKGTVLFP